MKKPTWTPKPQNYSFCEVESVFQDDGKIASFRYDSTLPDKGWVLEGYKDKYDFWIWSEEDNNKMWDDKITIAQHLINSKLDIDKLTESIDIDIIFKLKRFELDKEERMYAYKYGGFLSSRGGYFIVNKNNPNKILRSIMTIIS